MKKFSKMFQSLKTIFKSNSDPHSNTDATSTFYKKAEAYDVHNSNSYNNNTKIENRVESLDRVLLKGVDRQRVMLKIQELILRSNVGPVPDELKDACEIVHYHAVNNVPVRVSLVKTLLPDYAYDPNDIVNEDKYEEWLRYKNNMDARDSTIEVDDTYGMNVKGGKGKKPQQEWKGTRTEDNPWKKV